MIGLAAAIGAALVLGLCLLRLFAGPTLYDRMLAANSVVSKAALICSALAVVAGRADWIDVALALVLATFVVNAAILKFFRARTFQAPFARGAAREEA